MPTIINNPDNGRREIIRERDGSAAGIIIGILVALILVALFFAYGLPTLRTNNFFFSEPSVNNVTVPQNSIQDDGTGSPTSNANSPVNGGAGSKQ